MKIFRKISLAIMALTMFFTANFASLDVAKADLCAELDSGFSEFLDCSEDINSFSRFSGGIQAPSEDGLDPSLTQSKDVKSFALRIINFALSFLGFIAVAIIIYSGFQYVFSAVDSDGLEAAKANIKNSIIGIVIILASFAIVNTVISGLTTGESGGDSQVRGSADNRKQLANFNSASDQVKIIRNDFALEVSKLQKSTLALSQALRSVNPNTLNTSRANYIAYLNDLKGVINTISASYGFGSATQLKSIEVKATIDSAIRLINSVSRVEEAELLSDQLENSFTNAIDDFINSFSFSDAGIQADFFCSLPPNQRPVNKIVKDCGEDAETQVFDVENVQNIIKEIIFGNDTDAGFTASILTDYQSKIGELILNLSDIKASLAFQNLSSENNTISELLTTLIGEQSRTELIEFLKLPTVQTASLLASLHTVGLFLDEFNTVSLNRPADPVASSSDIIKGATDFALSSDPNVISTIQNLNKLSNVLETVKFTFPVISTNISQGSSPLIVQFDASGSFDPAEQTISADNIAWDIVGDGAFSSNTNGSEDIECTSISANKTTFTCTFTKPGSYRVGLRVKSQDDTGAILPGVAFQTIRVLPPTTLIKLVATADNVDQTLIEFNADGTVKTEETELKVTLKDAENGVKFNAAGTTDEDNLAYTWKFSDSENIISGSDKKEIEKTFNQRGRVTASLEVQNKAGKVDRKLFTVNVVDTVAIIRASASEVAANGTITLDGSLSRSDFGTLDFDWNVEGIELSEAQKTAEIIKLDLKDFENIVGDHKVTLNVETASGETASSEISFKVLPETPVLSFAATVASKSQPNTYILDASGSENLTGNQEDLRFKWSMQGLPESKFEIIDGSLEDDIVKIRFKEKGDFPVKLKVFVDGFEDDAFVEVEKLISVLSALDLELDPNTPKTKKLELDATGALKADVEFKVKSLTCDFISMEFGDGKKEEKEVVGGEVTFTHSYKRAGSFDLRIIGRKDNEVVRTKELFVVSGGNKPVAMINVLLQNNKFSSDSEMPEIFRKQGLKFDASDSINTDGTSRNLRYNWNMGDGKIFTQKSFDFKYRDLPPTGQDAFTVNLTVTDTEDPTKVSETTSFKIKVVEAKPTLEKVDVTELSGPQTPFKINVKAIGARDDDGRIDTYKYYYFLLDNPEKKLGTKISGSPSEILQIDTLGPEGEEMEVGVCIDVKDNDGNESTCQDIFPEGAPAVVTLENGPNELPTAKFRVTRTSLTVGDTITFVDESIDPDGKIVEWRYDMDGDNSFANDEVITEKSFDHVFKRKSPPEGFSIRSEVLDDKGGRVVSSPITIFVDSTLEDPTAAFTFEIDNLNLLTQNNSVADAVNEGEIVEFQWDFDIETDSDGDGVKNNDIDSIEDEPLIQLPKSGTYKVQLTVIDNQGNRNSVVREATVGGKLQAPVAAFTSSSEGLSVSFKNNSRADEKNGGELLEFIWDFDTTFDADGDGDPANDQDSTLFEPTFIAPGSGAYNVKLTVFDNERNFDTIINQVFTESLAGAFDPVSNASRNVQGDRLPTTDPQLQSNQAVRDNLGLQSDLSATSKPVVNDGSAVNRSLRGAPASETGFDLQDFIRTNPPVNPEFDSVEVPGSQGNVTFLFETLPSDIAMVLVDKNIFFDSNSGQIGSQPDNVRNNDVDFETQTRENYTTDFSARFAPTKVKVTIIDSQGNAFSDTVDITFSDLNLAGSLSFAIDENLPAILYFVILLVLLFASNGIIRHRNENLKL